VTARRRSGTRRPSGTQPDAVTNVALAATAWLPPLAFGGAFGWSVTFVAWVCCSFLAIVLWLHRVPLPRVGADVVVVLGLVWTVAQAVPLPWLVGDGQAEVMLSYQLAGATSWTPISLDPGGTQEQVVVGAGVVAAYVGARLIAARRGRKAVLRVVALSPALVVVVGLLHELVDAGAVYGWYTPQFADPALMGPLLNPNHLGGFAAFGAALSAGFAIGSNTIRERTLFGGAASLCAATAISAGSRGAVLSLVIGLGWVVTVLVTRRRTSSPTRTMWVTLGIVVCSTLATIVYAGLDRIGTDFANGDVSKVELIGRAAPLLLEQPILGIGRGAFEPVFAGLSQTSIRFTHPENLIVQWGIEWGLPFAGALCLILGRDLARAATSRKIEVAVAAGAIAAIVVHDLVDFVLEMPGVVVVVALALGAVVSQQSDSSDAPSVEARALKLLAAVVALLAVSFGVGVHERRPETWMERLLASGQHGDADEVDALVRRAVALHPLDPGIAIHAGHAYRRHDRSLAIGWLNRSMQLAPAWSSPHVLAAAILTEMGARDQALLEIREAEGRQLGSSHGILCRVFDGLSAEHAIRALPPEPHQRIHLSDRLVRCLSTSEGARLDEHIVEELGPTSHASTRIARRLADSGRHADAIAVLDAIPLPDEAALVLRARVLRARGGVREALDALPPRPETWDGQVLRAELASDLDDTRALERELSRLRSRAAGNPQRLARAWSVAGQIEERRGNLGAAMQAFERAHRLEPDSTTHLRAVERLANVAGQAARALAARRELCRLQDARACDRLRAATREAKSP
jgi:tetratricopeptide (TPR) repeat protein